MKKLYFLAAFITIGFINSGRAQYTATNSGNWSNSITWAPGAVPSTVCNSCTITVNAGVIVQLDQHLELAGSSILTLQDGAQIIIGNSSQSTIPSGYNIVLDTLPGNSTIILKTANSIINAAAAGTYDGVFVGPFPNSVYQKIVGNPPTLFIGNQASGTSPAAYGQSLSGPHVLFSGGTLPITLTSFNAVMNNSAVNVTWTVEQQVDLSKFVVLRSGNGSSWENIGNVVAKQISSGSASYNFVDPSPLHGINYYRIQSLDFNGNNQFSEIKMVQGMFIKGLMLSPNPARDHINITFGNNISSGALVRLLNLNGQVMQQQQLSNVAGTTVLLNVNNYPAGIYTVHVKTDDGTQSAYKVLITH